MELTGRVTADAEVRKTKNEKQFVSFSIAINDYYKTKTGEEKEFTEYFNCSYWLSTKVADSLLKGSIVTVTGRLYLNEYKDKEGNHHANLAVHTSNIKILAKGGKKTNTAAEEAKKPETVDDLPF